MVSLYDVLSFFQLTGYLLKRGIRDAKGTGKMTSRVFRMLRDLAQRVIFFLNCVIMD